MTSKYQAGEPWADTHDVALLRAVVHLVMTNRSILYAEPSLAGVNYNGGDRINKKTQQLLRKLADEVLGGDDIIKEALASTKSSKGGKSQKSPGKDKGRKDNDTSPKTTPKKRKVRMEETDHEKPEMESEGE